MTSIVLFVFALTAIVGMIVFKNWEMKAGKTVFREARFSADKAVVLLFIFVKGHLSTKGKRFSREIIHHTAFHFTHFVLNRLKFIEQKLARVINFIKGRGVINKNKKGDASRYLKDISQYDRHPDRK